MQIFSTTYAQFFPLNTGTICLKYFSKLKQQSFQNSKSVINFHQSKVLFLSCLQKFVNLNFYCNYKKTINIMCNINFEVFIIKLYHMKWGVVIKLLCHMSRGTKRKLKRLCWEDEQENCCPTKTTKILSGWLLINATH